MRSLKSAVLKVLGVYLIGCVVITLCLVADEIVPRTKTHFWNYQLFNMYTDFTPYPKELPESAHNIKYYYYEGFLVDKSGYHAAYSRGDYDQMKDNRLINYKHDYPEIYCYNGDEKRYLNSEKMQEWRIDFLDKLLPKEQRDRQYYFLGYYLSEGQEVYAFDCVLCNDETCEMIEISYHGPN